MPVKSNKSNKPATKTTKEVKEMKEEKLPVFSTEDAVEAIAALEGENAVDVSKKDISAVIRGLRLVCADAIGAGKKIQLTGLFSATPSYRAEREANNVATGEKMKVPETVCVSVKAGKSLKDAANGLDPKQFAKK